MRLRRSMTVVGVASVAAFAGPMPSAPVVPRSAGNPAAPAPRTAMTIPARYEDGRLYVPVSLVADTGASRAPMPLGWFIFDTGAQATIIDQAVARRLGLSAVDAGIDSGAGAGSIREGRTAGMPLRVGPVPYAPREIIIAPLDSLLAASTGRHVAGIIGSQFFQEHVLDLRASWRSIGVDRPLSASSQERPVAVLPIELRDAIPYVQGTLVLDAARDTAPLALRLLVDLGAKAPLLLTEHALALAGGERALPPHVLASLGAGVGGETRYYFTRARRLTVGDTAHDVTVDSLPVGFSAASTLRATAFDGLLGAPFLSRFGVRIDYRRRQLTLYRSSPAGAADPDFDRSGLFLTTGGPSAMTRVYAHRVITDSPAERAGIRPGDELLAVDGHAVASRALSELRRILRQPAGASVQIVYARAGRRFSTTLSLRPLL